MQSLQRRLGVVGSMAIGIAAMLGAGVFFVWTPAWNLAGQWMLLSLAIASVVATLNGLVTTQLAIQSPVSGGIYSYGRIHRGDFVGFLAGWFFLTGKTASAAAIALIAAGYLAPGSERLVATALIVVFSAIVIAGIRLTAGISVMIAGVVLVGLYALAIPAISLDQSLVSLETSPGWSVVTVAGLMFFAFAGYARMATLGEEVVRPRTTLPRAIVGALAVVLVTYAIIAVALIPKLSGSVAPDNPLQLLAPQSLPWAVGILAVVACCGSLLAILAGLSRTSLQMARHRDLPGILSRVSPRTKGPVFSELAVALAAIVLVVATDPLWLVGLSGAGVLSYYAIGHLSALAQPRQQRFLPAVVPVVGLVLCAVLVVSLPVASLVAGVVWAGVGTLWFAVARHRRSGSSAGEPGRT